MAASHDNFFVTTLIDRVSGAAARVADMITGSITTRVATSATTIFTLNEGNPTIIAYTGTGTEVNVGIDDQTIALGTPTEPFIFTVKDEGGGAATDIIIVTPESGLIDGSASKSITTNYGSFTFYVDGTSTHVLHTT